MRISRYKRTVAMILSVGLFITVSTLSATAQAYDSVDYFPLEIGNTWTFNEDFIKTVINPDPNDGWDDEWMLIEYSGNTDNIRESFTNNDVDGLLRHGFYFPVFDLSDWGLPPATLRITFHDDPVTITEADIVLETPVYSGGSADLKFGNFLNNQALQFEAESTAEAFETISVPLGVFRTIRVKTTIHVWGTIKTELPDEPIDMYIEETVWIAKGIGVVKSLNYGTIELTSTNLPIPPRPMPWIPLLLLGD